MKIKISFGIMLAIAFGLHAQKTWTLQQCIDYAMKNNLSIKQSMLNQKTAENQYKMAKYSWLPSLSAGMGQSFGFGQSPSYNGVYVNNSSSSTSVNASLGIPLFAGLRIYNQTKASNLNLMATALDLEKVKNDISLNIAALYMQIVYNKELKKIAEQQLELAVQQLNKSKELATVGKIAESEVYESSAQVAIYQVTLVESNNTLLLSILDLVQMLELSDIQNFDVVSPTQFENDEITILSSANNIYDYAIKNQPEIEAARLRLQQSKYDLNVNKSEYIPSLSFGANYGNGYYYYYNSSENESFNNQIKQNGRTSLGVSLSIPIFDRMSTYYNVRNAQLSIQGQEIALDNAAKKLQKEIQQAYYNAITAQQKYEASENSYKASKIAYEYAEAKFDSGKATVFELNENRVRLFKSDSERVQAKYEYLYSCRVLNFYNGKAF